jgi:hypothetical protein
MLLLLMASGRSGKDPNTGAIRLWLHSRYGQAIELCSAADLYSVLRSHTPTPHPQQRRSSGSACHAGSTKNKRVWTVWGGSSVE